MVNILITQAETSNGLIITAGYKSQSQSLNIWQFIRCTINNLITDSYIKFPSYAFHDNKNTTSGSQF